MITITLRVPEEDYDFIMRLADKLGFKIVILEKTEDEEASRDAIMNAFYYPQRSVGFMTPRTTADLIKYKTYIESLIATAKKAEKHPAFYQSKEAFEVLRSQRFKNEGISYITSSEETGIPPRKSWKALFEQAFADGHKMDEDLLPEVTTEFEKTEWTW